MKTSFKYLLVASMLAIGFTSCSKDDDVNKGGDDYDGERSTLKITIQNPPSTYAYDTPVEADEAKGESVVTTAYVSFFNPTNKQHVESYYVVVNPADPTTVQVTNARVGTYDIYVGLNLSTTASETPIFLDKITEKFDSDGIYGVNTVKNTPADLFNSTTGFAMFSDVVKANEIISDGINTLNVTVSRMVAKVAPKESSTLNKTGITGANFFDLDFAIGQANTKIYAYQNLSPAGLVVDPNYGGSLVGTIPNANVSYADEFYNEFRPTGTGAILPVFLPVNAPTTAYKDLNVKYAPENTSTATSFKGEVTYVSVRAKFIPEQISTWENNDVVLTPNPDLPAYVDKDYYVVNAYYSEEYTEDNYFFLDKAQAEAFCTALGGSDFSKLSEYKNGLCYYPVFMNKAGNAGTGNSTNHDILRNEYYELTINNIKGLGNPDPEIPDPWTPIGGDAELDVTVTIQNWNTVKEDVDLEV